MKYWQSKIKDLKDQDLFREPPTITAREGKFIEIGFKRYIDFSSNDSLGLAQQQQNVQYPAGSGASRLVTGNVDCLTGFEQYFAEWMGFESALFFPSGWHANVTLMAGLFDSEDLVLSDSLNHASIVDGLRLSGCRKKIFAHKNLDELRDLIAEEKPRAVVVESLYSVDGDFFPLTELYAILREQNILLVVDEAHATGLYGECARGLCDKAVAGVDIVKVSTCSKAVGAQGAMVLCSSLLRSYLMNKCRGFMFSTGASPVLARLVANNTMALRKMNNDRKNLFSLAQEADKRLRQAGFKCLNDPGAHILTIDFASHEEGRKQKEKLVDQGIWVAWLRYPTIPEGRSRIRISLAIHHKLEDVDKIIEILTS